MQRGGVAGVLSLAQDAQIFRVRGLASRGIHAGRIVSEEYGRKDAETKVTVSVFKSPLRWSR